MRSNIFQLWVLIVLVFPVLVTGCVSFPSATPATTPSTITTPSTSTPSPSAQAPEIQAWLTPSTITPKGTAALNWNVTGATSVTIDQGIGTVPFSGSRPLSPDVTTTYTITAYYSGGTVVNSLTLAVAPVGKPSGIYEKDWLASTYTKEYHFPGCSIAQHVPQPSRVWFDTIAQAKAAGYHPCPVCKPPR
jgi:hypothetical protein